VRSIAQEPWSGPRRTASPDRSDLALELTFGNPQHLSSYAMDRLDVGRHLKDTSDELKRRKRRWKKVSVLNSKFLSSFEDLLLSSALAC